MSDRVTSNGADDSIQPFVMNVPETDLIDLADRLARTRWPDELPGVGWTYGASLEYVKELAEYWRTTFDWKAQEAELNRYPQFTTVIDGQQIHFFQVRSNEPNAMPLLLLHGWPGSVVEFMKIIGPLTDPAAFGGNSADAFDVVIPSLPGFGFSGPTHETGWDVQRVTNAFAVLMQRLGYDRYATQGGDMGAFIAPHLGRVDSEHVIGVHVNAASVGFIPFGGVEPEVMEQLTDLEKERVAKIERFTTDQWGYNALQSTRPQTLAFALHDSPVGQLAWIVEKFKEWTDPAKDLPHEAVDRDHLLTNVSLYWFTGTAGSSARMYYENAHSSFWGALTRVEVPVGVAVFANDVAIRHFSEWGNNIRRWTDFDTGGHFAAMETPE
ncbi:MAG: epoxide hydrolase family protein, partial [Thermomicrobiales bacterium]